MTTLSTHDTKRSEDVRARISVIAESPAEWAAAVRRWNAAAPLGDGPLAHLLWQAAVGAWPIDRDRLHAYAEKAAREAGVSTGWIDSGRSRSRSACTRWWTPSTTIRSCTASLVATADRAGRSWPGELVVRQADPAHHARGAGRLPGIELWDLSLVDPDNRRPVDHAARRDLLAGWIGGWRPEFDPPDRPTMATPVPASCWSPAAALRLRRDRPELFTAPTGHSRPTGRPPTT